MLNRLDEQPHLYGQSKVSENRVSFDDGRDMHIGPLFRFFNVQHDMLNYDDQDNIWPCQVSCYVSV